MQKTTDKRIIINSRNTDQEDMDNFQEKKNKIENKINEQIENILEQEIKESEIKESEQENINENLVPTNEQKKFEEIQHYNNKERLREIGIYVRAQDVYEVNKYRITEKMIKILELFIKEGINIEILEINKLEEPILTTEQIKNNIKILKEGGINIKTEDINIITKEIFTFNDICKKKALEETGFKFKRNNIELLKYFSNKDIEILKKINDAGLIALLTISIIKKLVDDDIEKMKTLQELGISIELDDETLERMRAGKYEKINELKNLGINISDSLKYLKNLLESDIDTVIKLKKIGIKISNVENLGNTIGLDDEDIQNIEKLIGIGIQIDENNLQQIKGITENDINNIINIEKLKKNIKIDDINYIKGMKLLSKNDIENIKELEKFGIKFDAKYIKDMEGITNENIKNIKKLMKMGKKFEAKQIKYLKLIEEEDIETIKKLEKNFRLKIEKEDIVFIIGLRITDTNIKNMKKLSKLGFKVKTKNIGNIYDITAEDLDKIERIINLGIGISNGKINEENAMDEQIKNYKGVKESYIEQLKKFKELGIKISRNNIKIEATEKDIEKIKIIKGIGINIYSDEIGVIKEIELTEKNIETIKKFGSNIQNLYEIKALIENKKLIETDDKNIYKGYNYTDNEIKLHQQYTKGKIIEEIEQYIQEKIDDKKEIGEQEIINKVRSKLIILPQKERINITGTIYKLINKNNTIRKYLDFESGLYKSPKELLCAMRGITNQKIIKEICDDITVKQHGSGLYFFVPEERSYRIIHGGSLKLTKESEGSAGVNCYYSYIEDLIGTLSINRGKDPLNDKESYEYGTIRHEGQHNRNSFFMPDKAFEPTRLSKDEITAALREGKDTKTIEEALIQPKKKGGIYQYNLKRFKRMLHKQKVKKLIRYTKDIVSMIDKSNGRLNKDEIISTLSSIKLEGWEELHKNMIEIIKAYEKNEIQKSKIKKIKEKFIKQIKGWSENNKLIENLIEWRNFIFPNDEINMDKFWRTGTEKLETVINMIKNCNSIEEIKYIINDPKYSNISRGPNNKGGIEISAIIDEVKAGKLSEEFIPVEIRSKVTSYIK